MCPVSAPSTPLFHIARPDGSISGPHRDAFLRQGLASGELSPETRVSLKGTEDWLPLSGFMQELGLPELPEPGRRQAPCRMEDGLCRRGWTAGKRWGVALAAGTLVLSVPASVLLHRGMTTAGLACLVAMAACLAGALALLDPLRK